MKKVQHISFLVSLLLGLIILCGTVALAQSGWTSQTSGTPNNLLGVFFTDANTGTAVGAPVGGVSAILRTTNGGTTWTSQTNPGTQWLKSVSFTDANTGTAVGDTGTILRTTA